MFLPADRVIGGRDALHGRARSPSSAASSVDFLLARRAARWACRSPSPTRPSTPRPTSRSARHDHVARAAGISDEEILDLLRVLGRGLAPGRRDDAGAAAEDSCSSRASASTSSRSATRYAAAQLYPMRRPAGQQHAHPAPAPDGPERGDQRRRAQRRAAAGLARDRRLLRRPRRLHAARRGSAAGRARPPGRAPGSARAAKSIDAAGAAGQDDRRRRDARLAEPEPLLDARARRCSTPPTPRARTSPSCAPARPSGPALPRAGDWFGRPVNLASRITAVARPGSLLAERAAARVGARRPTAASFAGERRLKRHPRAGGAVPARGEPRRRTPARLLVGPARRATPTAARAPAPEAHRSFRATASL